MDQNPHGDDETQEHSGKNGKSDGEQQWNEECNKRPADKDDTEDNNTDHMTDKPRENEITFLQHTS